VSRFTVVYVDCPREELEIERAVLARADAELVVAHATNTTEALAAAKMADGIICRFLPLGRELIAACPNLKVIVRTGVGTDNIDVVAATELGVAVCNAPDYCIEEVASHTLAFVLACNRRLFEQNSRVRNGPPVRLHERGHGLLSPVGRLSEQTLALVSFGAIAQAVAVRARHLGLTLKAYDPYVDPAVAEAHGVELVALSELLAEADYLSVHAPLTPSTAHLIGERELSAMRPSAYVIATSRGGVIDETALLEALRRGQLAGAALDVWEDEPLSPDNPLLALPNVLGTPHTAYYSDVAARILREMSTGAVADALLGVRPHGLVNPNARVDQRFKERA